MSKKKNLKKVNKKPSVSKTKKKVADLTPPFWTDKTKIIAAIALLLITFFAFKNTTENAFVNWDDDKNFYENELITTLNEGNFWENTKKIFSTDVIGNYNPLSIWSFAIDQKMYGLDQPGKWHLTNVLLHMLCVFFVFRICLLLGLEWKGASLAALLFAIHPMRVESVAWVTERKDVLFGVFYLSALYMYIKSKINKKKYYVIITLLFVLALLSKIQAVILPMSMLCVDYYMDGKINFKSILRKAHYFILSILFGVIGIVILGNSGSLESTSSFPIWQRIFIGSYSYLVYLAKSIFPYELVPLYPYPSSFPSYFYATILAVPAVLYGLYVAWKKELKIWVFGILFFTFNIFFLLQILGAGQGFLADRFTYIAYFGLFFIAGYYFDKLLKSNLKFKMPLLAGIAGLMAFYIYTTVNQNKVWKNSETLWTHVLKYYDKTTLPYGNRANYLRDQGRTKEALRDYSQAIAMKNEGAQAYNSRARLYFQLANSRDTLLLALADYNRAIELEPDNGEFLINRGATYARLGNVKTAISDIDKGLVLKPDHAVGYLNRSVLYNRIGNLQKALDDIEIYLKFVPYESDIWYEKARALRGLDRLDEAIKAYSQAIKLNRAKGLYFYERARTLTALNRISEAKKDLQMAINLKFEFIDSNFRQQLGF